MTVYQRKAYAMIIHQFAGMFAKYDEELGGTHWVKHAIDTGNAILVKGLEALEDMLTAMERQRMVNKSNGPWSFPVLLVTTADGVVLIIAV